uniref:LITAF domain-containing protein n=1 Tax=Arion vulgaris TaxID=1028688 RepID=A0A0B7AYP2_9EUPU
MHICCFDMRIVPLLLLTLQDTTTYSYRCGFCSNEKVVIPHTLTNVIPDMVYSASPTSYGSCR